MLRDLDGYQGLHKSGQSTGQNCGQITVSDGCESSSVAQRRRQELPSLMEPTLLGVGGRYYGELSGLAFDLVQKAAGFRRSLPDPMVVSLAGLVRSMNCYYSNLIEGHNTHPIDIEKALRQDYSQDIQKRNLQLEAQAHIRVQEWIDNGGLAGYRALTVDGIRETHQRFCELLPPELLIVEDTSGRSHEALIPGQLRDRDVQVGSHVAISPGAVPRFLQRYEQVYSPLRKTDAVLAAAAAHHRLLWIHPFLDGNGRVARLLSHALLWEVLGTAGLWSIARGFARTVTTYRSLLANADLPRRNDLDGRGTLSEEALAAFTRYFLETAIDQIHFLETLIQPDILRNRVLLWAKEELSRKALPAGADAILQAVLYRGELERGDVDAVLGASERTGRRVVAALMAHGALVSASSRAPLRLAFPATLANRWLPGLFPEA